MIQQDKRTDLIHWTNVWVSSRDKIFTPANQHQYWASRCAIQEIEGEHYVFQDLPTGRHYGIINFCR